MIDLLQAEIALEKVDSGLKKYMDIMDTLHSTDVSQDAEFQKKYNGFYKMRQRKAEFYQEYYKYMEEHKNLKITFGEVLTHFYNKFGRLESSFCSKLLATINPEMPVWDVHVLNNLGLKKPAYSSKNRLEANINLYDKIVQWYEEFLLTDDAKKLIVLFNKKYSNANITDIKKIDLVLWQMR